MSKKPKIGTAIKKVTEALGIDQCVRCEERQFAMDKWNHKKPIIKVEDKDKEAYLKGDNSQSYISDLYLKYFGLDNTKSDNENIYKAMVKDLDKLFKYGQA
jgi:hypothetical protein